MLKTITQLEHIAENKVCRFICDHDTPLSAVKECLFQFQKYIGQIEDYAKAQKEAADKAEAAKVAQAPQEESPKVEELKQ